MLQSILHFQTEAVFIAKVFSHRFCCVALEHDHGLSDTWSNVYVEFESSLSW